MIPADYTYLLLNPNILLLTDLKNPMKASLTNSITLVLQSLYKKGIDWTQMRILQKDSEDVYSEVTVSLERNGQLISASWKHLSDDSLLEALSLMSENQSAN